MLAGLAPVAQFIDDPHVQLVSRRFDAEWQYSDLTKRIGGGYNPFAGQVYVAHDSLVVRWLGGEQSDLRALNENDAFVQELAMCVHDYLHAWAGQQLAELAPELGFGTAPLCADNLEAQVFGLLVTEAVATVGADYWWLSSIDLAEMLDIGSRFRTLTVSYVQSDLPEFQRCSPDFEVLDPSFFRRIAEFYCHGRFSGFDLSDVRRSPRLLRWLRHEIEYGQVQRRYSRQWMQHLAGIVAYAPGQLGGPVACDEPWQRALLDELGQRLWAKIRGEDPQWAAAPIDPERTWRAPTRGPVDFRFTNLACFADPDAEVERRGIAVASLAHWADQRIRLHAFPYDDREFRRVVPNLRDTVERDQGQLLRWALSSRPRLEPEPESHIEMFFPR